MHRSSANWTQRLLLGAGILALALAVAVAVLTSSMQPMFDARIDVFGLPASLVTLLAAGGIGSFGFLWLHRVLRPPEDEPPKWRYRDRR